MTQTLIHTTRIRGVTLLEMMIAGVLVTILIAASFSLVSTTRRTTTLDTARTELAQAAHTQLTRLRATPWDNLKVGETTLSPDDLRGLGLEKEGEKTKGQVRVRDVEGLPLREIEVHLVYDSVMGPLEQTFSIWRGR
ncbi:MAG TPA: prepilin-type N-terminal cleavage/methylation domain-containing protein [Candidatus Sumerlaeota bacterium]|nr:prepilin-type N-terminal cleavage/methylation domain-containing protein [Candidatus Sumerlaeota bacterium]